MQADADADGWDVALGNGVVWSPCHGWTDDTTTWVDAHLVVHGRKTGRYIDIGSFTDKEVPAGREGDVEAAWLNGRVYAFEPYRTCPHVLALVVPFDALNTKLVHEALRRFQP